MKCIECNSDMKFISCNDTGSISHIVDHKSYAYNVYECRHCLILCKEDVWENKGELWIHHNNTIEKQ